MKFTLQFFIDGHCNFLSNCQRKFLHKLGNFFDFTGIRLIRIGSWASVTRFGKILPLWQNFKNICQIVQGLFSV